MHPLFDGPLSHHAPLSLVHATHGFFHFGSPQSTFSCCCSFASDKDTQEPFRKKKAKKKKKEKKEREDERAIVLIFMCVRIYLLIYSLRSL